MEELLKQLPTELVQGLAVLVYGGMAIYFTLTETYPYLFGKNLYLGIGALLASLALGAIGGYFIFGIGGAIIFGVLSALMLPATLIAIGIALALLIFFVTELFEDVSFNRFIVGIGVCLLIAGAGYLAWVFWEVQF